ncbi:MAG: S41 family peptidase, partial [Pirellulaceae bacterium]
EIMRVGIPARGYADHFRDLYETLGDRYAHFESKGIDWEAVGEEMLLRGEQLKSHEEFGLLCMELVARLEDSHARVMNGSAELPSIPFPAWDPGFSCLLDDRNQPVIYHVDPGSAAGNAGMQVGMTITRINDEPVADVFARNREQTKKYQGFSSDRYLDYQTARFIGRQMNRNAMVDVSTVDVAGNEHSFSVRASMGVRYLPRLPVPRDEITDSANVDWTKLDDETGYIYVRRIRDDLIEQLDAAVADLQECRGLVIDVRGNSGGGFDSKRSFRNFDPDDPEEAERPRFAGPIAVLIDSRCISAGEGWASWFEANDRATFFGAATAGASAGKQTIDVLDGAFRVRFSVKAYRGFLERPIEPRGIEPDVPVKQTASDLAEGTDTVLNAARNHLSEQR